MSHLDLILIFVLQLEACSSAGPRFIYRQPGDDVALPCRDAPSPDTTCSVVTWLYNSERTKTFTEVNAGKVQNQSGRAARLSLGAHCSLAVNNITAEDAGLYICRQGRDTSQDFQMLLNVLTISPSQPADQKEIMLECSMSRYPELGPCQLNSIRWVDEAGTELLGKADEYEVFRQMNCVSFLAVKRQSGGSRRYTCQFVERNNVLIQADYTPASVGGMAEDHADESNSDLSPTQIYIIIGVAVGTVALMVVIAAVLVKYRKKAKVTEDVQKLAQHPDDPESCVTYITVSYANQRPAPETKDKEEVEVMYSTIVVK